MARLAAIAARTWQLAIAGIYRAGSGHPGGALSAADLLAVLYGAELSIPGGTTDDPGRDRFVLSKVTPRPRSTRSGRRWAMSPTCSRWRCGRIGTASQGHPHVLDLPLSETSTGSLGQGFSVAIGMALGLRHHTFRPASIRCSATANARKARSGRRDVRRPSRPLQSLRRRRLQQAPVRRPQRQHHGLEPFAENGAPSAGTPSRSTATTAPPSLAARSPKPPPRTTARPSSSPTRSRARASPTWRTSRSGGSVKMKPDETLPGAR